MRLCYRTPRAKARIFWCLCGTAEAVPFDENSVEREEFPDAFCWV